MSDEEDKKQDEELRKLLEELDQPETVDAEKVSKKNKKKNDGTIEVQPLKRSEPKKEPKPVEDDFLALETAESEDLSSEFQGQFQKLLAKYGPITDDIIKNYDSDRQQAQDVLDHFLNTLATGGKIPRIYVEKIADVLKAKNDIAQTPIKMLDSIAKLMSAAKGSEVLNQINVNYDREQLADILNTKTYEDEE